MTIDEKVERAVEFTRATWGFVTAVCGICTLIFLPWWAFLPFVLFSVFTYYGSLWFLGLILGLTLDRNQLEKELSTGAVVFNETIQGFTEEEAGAAGLGLGDVVATGDVFGRFMDQSMFEWIDVVADKKGAVYRYLFEQVTPRDKAGNFVLPRGEGFACYNGITYKAGQPA
jgi:hypothetical protein